MRGIVVKALCSVAIMAGCAQPRAEGEKPTPRIVIDGHFDDWQAVEDVLLDPVDVEAVFCDFRELKVAADGEAFYGFIRLQHEFGLRLIGGGMMALVDADGSSATGWEEHGLSGVDLVLGTRFHDPRLVKERAEESRVRFWPEGTPPPDQWEQAAREVLSGAHVAPTIQSDRTEFRIVRGTSLAPSEKLAFASEGMRMKLVAFLESGELLDETDVLEMSLPPLRPGPGPETGSEIDSLQRAQGTDLRVVTWNVSHRTMTERLDDISRVLHALDGDILLLNEVSNKLSPDGIERMVGRLPTGSDSREWKSTRGEGGGDERCLVASRFPFRPSTSINRTRYPKGIHHAIDVLFDHESQTDIFGTIDADICAAGAVVEAGNKRILAVSLGLQSKGQEATGWEEVVRRLQAGSVQSAISAALEVDPVDAIVVGGDFNLVVTDLPLQLVRTGLDSEKRPLSIVEALQPDGFSNATWRQPGSGYLPGRLDYILFSGSTLAQQRSFVFDSADLDNRWLAKHGLKAGDSSVISDHLPIVADFAKR